MNHRLPPGSNFDVNNLSSESATRHEQFVDLFGQYVMWLRNWTVSSTSDLVELDDERNRLPSIARRPYEEAALLSSEDRQRAVNLAEASVHAFIQLFLQVLGHQGDDFLLAGELHSVRLRLLLEVIDIESGSLVYEEVINRLGEKHFADYWGRWINRSSNK